MYRIPSQSTFLGYSKAPAIAQIPLLASWQSTSSHSCLFKGYRLLAFGDLQFPTPAILKTISSCHPDYTPAIPRPTRSWYHPDPTPTTLRLTSSYSWYHETHTLLLLLLLVHNFLLFGILTWIYRFQLLPSWNLQTIIPTIMKATSSWSLPNTALASQCT